jgi:hypothetical protein
MRDGSCGRGRKNGQFSNSNSASFCRSLIERRDSRLLIVGSGEQGKSESLWVLQTLAEPRGAVFYQLLVTCLYRVGRPQSTLYYHRSCHVMSIYTPYFPPQPPSPTCSSTSSSGSYKPSKLSYSVRLSRSHLALASLSNYISPPPSPSSNAVNTERVSYLRNKFRRAVDATYRDTSSGKWVHVSELAKLGSTRGRWHGVCSGNTDHHNPDERNNQGECFGERPWPMDSSGSSRTRSRRRSLSSPS